jgi:hypothetical protein
MHAFTPVVVALSCGAIVFTACGRSEEAAPAVQAEPVAAADPAAPAMPDPDHAPATAEERPGPNERVEALQSSLERLSRADFAEAFALLAADDIVWTEVGIPNGELTSVEAIIDYHRRARTGLSDYTLAPARIIDSPPFQVVEFVWSAHHSGALADGTPPTHKLVTSPGAMLLRYQEAGLVDRVWVFQDWTNARQQLGLAPGLPAGFEPMALPETPEIVVGPADPEAVDRYRAFMVRLGHDAQLQALQTRTSEDFSWLDLDTGKRISGIEQTNDYLTRVTSVFMPEATQVGLAVSAGPYLAAMTTNQLIYLGGFMGVPAEAQKVTTHTLDLVRFDDKDGRLQSIARYGNSYEILTALHLTAGSASKPEVDDGEDADSPVAP